MLKDDLPENVHHFAREGRDIYIVGTAHVSLKSTELVEQVVRDIQPDSVAVELCEPRYRALKDPEKWKNTDIVQVIKQGKAFLLLGQLILSGFQKRIGNKLGVKPGAEMMKAIELAEELGAETVLADREVSITLKRTWANLGLWGGLKLLMSLMLDDSGGSDELTEEDIERLKTSDALEEAMQEFAERLPGVRESLIDERDKYLASKINSAPGETVVAVVGAGHVPGISQYIHENIDVAPLETVPPPSPWRKIIGWGLPLLILAAIAYGFKSAGKEIGQQMVWDWILVNGAFGALGSLIALAHPITILVAFIASPFTSANPMIAGGWVAGLTEAGLRKPTVEDFENLSLEELSMKLAYTNRVTRVLLVVILTNLMGGIGTLLSGGVILSRFGQ